MFLGHQGKFFRGCLRDKAAILDAIDKTGLYSIKYHLKIGDKYCEACMKVAKLVEDGSEKLIIGVEKIGESVE